jgi:hypothetical protein
MAQVKADRRRIIGEGYNIVGKTSRISTFREWTLSQRNSEAAVKVRPERQDSTILPAICIVSWGEMAKSSNLVEFFLQKS